MEVISKNLAIEELKVYLESHLDEDVYPDGVDVEKDYKKTLKAMIDGRLVIQDGKPEYTLCEPLYEGKDSEIRKLTFKTRVLPSTVSSLARGIDLNKDSLKYVQVLTAHIIGLGSVKELDNLSKKDYLLIQELAPVFT